MDDLDAPWNLVRQVAHAPGPAARWKRAEQLLTQLIEKRAAKDPSGARGGRTRLERLIEAVEPNDPVLRQAQALNAQRHKPRAGAVPSAAGHRSG
ncbi:hypothetical protein [Sorangium sp. So ce124]|uniref:hypothetical protein n=1 Tax=Sorangium sp. So ce124 TaxID=3133280 RepID=UPI003F617717